MSVKPRKGEIKKLMPVLEDEYNTPEEAAEAILVKAYELYEGQARFWVVGQVRPNTGWKTPDEGRDAKVILGPFGTRRQAEQAGASMAYSSTTGEEAVWWAVEAHYGTPATWYDERKKRWQREGFMDKNPFELRLGLLQQWMRDHDGAEPPRAMQTNGWEGLDEFQVWFEETGGDPTEEDLHEVIRRQQQEILRLKRMRAGGG